MAYADVRGDWSALANRPRPRPRTLCAGCFLFIVGVDFFIVYIISLLLLLLLIVCCFDVDVLSSKTELILYSLCSHVIGWRTGINRSKPVRLEIFGAKLADWLRVQGQIRLLVRQRKHTSCSRGKPHLFTVTSHTAGKCLRRDKDVTTDVHCFRGVCVQSS